MKRDWDIVFSKRIDGSKPTPLYMQIIQAVIHDIESGRLAPGTYLPSSRELARSINVNRKTVVLAYEDLIAQGWLSASTTRGTQVCQTLPDATQSQVAPDETMGEYAETSFALKPPPQRPLALPEGSGIKIDEGSPDGRLFPPELISRAYRNASRIAAQENRLQYSDPRGHIGLRKSIAHMLQTQRGLRLDSQNICVTRGSQQAIFLSALALLKPGDAVIVEALTYEPAVAAFKALGAKIIPVGLDQHGIHVEEVEAVCLENSVKAVFVTPHHQFPTTVAMKPDRRLRLVELSRRFEFAIIEDDYDHEFHFRSQPLLPIASYAPQQVLYVGSLSKLLLPALRIGYLAAPKPQIDAFAHLISVVDGMGNTLTEMAVNTLIENGELRRHARKALKIYRARRAHFADLLQHYLGDLVRFDIPDGGLAFWLRFDTDLDKLESRAAAAGLRFASHKSFRAGPNAEAGLRLGFASPDQTEAEKVVSALLQASA
ncbi:MAG: PLP-dependent aminotransferase family protein [Pseudomonadota bacterium]